MHPRHFSDLQQRRPDRSWDPTDKPSQRRAWHLQVELPDPPGQGQELHLRTAAAYHSFIDAPASRVIECKTNGLIDIRARFKGCCRQFRVGYHLCWRGIWLSCSDLRRRGRRWERRDFRFYGRGHRICGRYYTSGKQRHRQRQE